MMKRYFVSILLVLVCFVSGAQDRIVERTYIATDRSDYIVGDVVRCSAFCFDLSASHRLSDFSSVAYIGLFSNEGLVQSAKAALVGGRGSAEFELDRTLPTGNYTLVAFTALNKNEKDYDFSSASRTITVFNPYTSQRLEGGVEIVDGAYYASALSSAPKSSDTGLVRIRANSQAGRNTSTAIVIDNLSGSDASLSVSVTREEDVIPAPAVDLKAFLAKSVSTPEWEDNTIPEYEGEIVHARVAGLSKEQLSSISGKFAFISVPGDKSDVYSAAVSTDGEIDFFTNNIYGRKDMICEIEGIPDDTPAHLEIVSPFAGVKVGAAEPMKLSSSLSEMLQRRSVYGQIERIFRSDTLYDYLPIRENLLFGENSIQYRLDDYTRFPLMEEVFTEFIPELRTRRQDRRRDIQVRMEDSYKTYYFSRGSSLMLLDGVPIFDHERVLAYDPLLVETINIYPATYYIGSRGYEGIVYFNTYKHNIQGMQFHQNVRIISFDGVSYPTAFTCSSLIKDSGYPDYRETLYWHPLLSVENNASEQIECKLPAYEGKFRIVVEGITSDGRPIYETASFEVR